MIDLVSIFYTAFMSSAAFIRRVTLAVLTVSNKVRLQASDSPFCSRSCISLVNSTVRLGEC